MNKRRIPLLAKLITNLLKVCNVIDVAAPKIRPFVPEPDQGTFDTNLAAIKAACDVIRAIEYMDTYADTNAPWGSK
jgi:hypothetical protein